MSKKPDINGVVGEDGWERGTEMRGSLRMEMRTTPAPKKERRESHDCRLLSGTICPINY